MNITIRLAKTVDAPNMAEIHSRSWEAAYQHIIPLDFIREKNKTRLALFQRIITQDNTTHYVIQADGKIVGFMCVAPPQDDDVDDSCYELHSIYLHPDYYRMGIGTFTMDFVIQKAKDLLKTSMLVWTFYDNTHACNFYKKCGFAPDGTTKQIEYGKTLDCMRMRRSI